MPPQHRNRHRDERAVRAKAVRPPCNDSQLGVDALHGGSPLRLQPLGAERDRAPQANARTSPRPPREGVNGRDAPVQAGRKAHICCLNGGTGGVSPDGAGAKRRTRVAR